MNKELKQVLSIVGIGLTICIVLVLLLPVRDWWLLWYSALSRTPKLLVDLLAIGLVAIVAAALLSPLEALGWWAGWYRSTLDTQTPAVAVPLRNIEGYVIYLDGVNQDEFEYLDNVEEFLDRLAAALPNHLLIGRQIMAYSVLNQSLLDPDRPLSLFWRLIDWIADRYPKNFIGFLVNIRNIIMVSVSADLRYGPIYNQGSAQVILNSLLRQGYQPGSGMPITLIGYSGGAQIASGAATYLWKALGKPPIEIVSLGGVISGNNQYLHLRHLYHLVGEKDSTARLGPLLFPGRRSFISWSKWNRALGQGKITIVPMGPVVHNGPNGYLDSSAYLPDGRSYLRQTLDVVREIVCKDSQKK